MKSITKASRLAALIIASYCGGGECANAGGLSVPTAFVHPRWQRQTIGAATTAESGPTSAALFASEDEYSDASSGVGFSGGDERGEEFIGEGKPIELESLRGKDTFMGLEPLSEGEDPFDQGIPLVTGTIVLFVSTWLTLAPFFMDPDVPDLPPPPPGMM